MTDSSARRRLAMLAKILVVEDYWDSRVILKALLQSLGYAVIEAADGPEGLEKARAEAPDLIIMDIGLPGMDGIETTVKLKENPATAKIPVVAYTIWKERSYQERAEKAGIVKYLTKPTPPPVFKEVIQKVLEAKC